MHLAWTESKQRRTGSRTRPDRRRALGLFHAVQHSSRCLYQAEDEVSVLVPSFENGPGREGRKSGAHGGPQLMRFHAAQHRQSTISFEQPPQCEELGSSSLQSVQEVRGHDQESHLPHGCNRDMIRVRFVTTCQCLLTVILVINCADHA